MERTDPSGIHTVILDAGPLIHLDELDCLFLLADFPNLIVPPSVQREVERHRPSALRNPAVRFTELPAPSGHALPLALGEAFNLDQGEQEALSFCFTNPKSVLLTDDAAARLAAKTAGIRAHGTIGLVIRAARRKRLQPAEVVRLLETIPSKTTLFIKQRLLDEIIEKVKSEYGLH